MKSVIRKMSILGAVITTGCTTTQDLDMASYPIPSETFKTTDTGVVIDAYSLQSCDKEIKLHVVEIDTNNNGKPEYIGLTDGDKKNEVNKTQKDYPVGRRVSMKKAADYFQWFEKVNCRCE